MAGGDPAPLRRCECQWVIDLPPAVGVALPVPQPRRRQLNHIARPLSPVVSTYKGDSHASYR